MKSQETQITETENNVPLSQNTTSYPNPTAKSELMTQEFAKDCSGNFLQAQVQADTVITREDSPSLGFRITMTLLILAIIFVGAIYYGIINP